MLINGVGHKIKKLKAGERITFGRYRLVYQGITYVETEPQPVPPPKFLLLIPGLAVCMLAAWLFQGPISISLPNKIPEPATIAAIESNLPAHELGVVEKNPRAHIQKPERIRSLPEHESAAKEGEVMYPRSEERRGGKECRSRWSPYH